jgi:membrane protease YdiL (CAAX protease family)
MFIITVVVFVPLTIYLINKKFIEKETIGITKGKSIQYSFFIGIIGGVLPFIISIWLLPYEKPIPDLYDYIKGVFFAPIWEEYFFRALIFSSLYFILVDYLYLNFLKSKKYDFEKYIYIGLAILITSAFFVLIHKSKAASVLIASLFITSVFYLNRSLISPIISHSVYNFCVLTYAFLLI